MPLSQPLQRFLTSYGYPLEKVASFERSTRLYHDLGWQDDSLDEDVLAIMRHFNVRFPTTRVGPYYPGMRTWDGFVTTSFGWTAYGHRIKEKYKPLTFGMIEDAIAKGVWEFD
jgi:hypothetical protein